MIVLGIDPGTLAAGYGAVRTRRGGMELLECGAVRARRSLSLAERLRVIHAGLAAVIERHRTTVHSPLPVMSAQSERLESVAAVFGKAAGPRAVGSRKKRLYEENVHAISA